MKRSIKKKIENYIAVHGDTIMVEKTFIHNGMEVTAVDEIKMTEEQLIAAAKEWYDKRKKANKAIGKRIGAAQEARTKQLKGKKSGPKYYMADFETTTPAAMERTGADRTEVWAWAITPIPCNWDESDCVTGTDLDSFMAWLEKNMGRDDIMYFHNLSFDGNFIVSWMLNHGMSFTSIGWKEKRYAKNCFDCIIGEQAGYYSLTIAMKKGCFQIIDSLKCLPFAVYNIGKSFHTKNSKLLIDYDGHDKPGIPLTPEEKRYVCNDVLVVGQALWETFLSRGYVGMTVGSNALTDYITRMGGKEAFREVFPALDNDEHNFAKAAYRGGISYVNPRIAGKHLRGISGKVYDVNSMYPGVMHSMSGNRYPVGKGKKYDFGITEKDSPAEQIRKIKETILKDEDHVFIIKFKADFEIKKEHMPCIQIKGTGRFVDTEYLTESNGTVDLATCSPEFILYLEQYDYLSFEFVDAYIYDSKCGLFDTFIDYWYAIKKVSKGAERELAKLMLNNLYGKFASAIINSALQPYLGDDGVVHYNHIAENRDSIYMPVGAFVTNYARCKLVRAIQANWDSFYYCDTDSIHIGAESKGIEMDDTLLGYWGLESCFTEAKYIRQKTYIELVDGVKLEVRCAGMPKSRDVEIDGKIVKVGPREHVTFDNFDIDYDWESENSPFKNCKLRRKVIKGGVVLLDSDFKMRRK